MMLTGRAILNARRSIRRRRIRIPADAQPIPTTWMKSEKERATSLGTSRPLVNTGNATAPPPCGVDPATKLPKTIVTDDTQLSITRPQRPAARTHTSHTTVTPTETPSAPRARRRVSALRAERALADDRIDVDVGWSLRCVRLLGHRITRLITSWGRIGRLGIASAARGSASGRS